MTSEPGPVSPNRVATAIVAAVGIVVIVGVCSGVMYLITTFLFAFSGGQYRMVSVVGYGAMAVAAGTLLVTAIVWMQRSLAAAAKTAGLALAVGWVAAVFVEWLLSLVLGGS